MQKNISTTIFYSLLFAMGVAPTIAMMIIRAQTQDPQLIYQALIGLSVIIACILGAHSFDSKCCTYFLNVKSVQLEQKIKPCNACVFGLECGLFDLLVGSFSFRLKKVT